MAGVRQLQRRYALGVLDLTQLRRRRPALPTQRDTIQDKDSTNSQVNESANQAV